MSEDEGRLEPFIEEHFGILTDDELYLDCILVHPADMSDADLRALRVWVPKFPLTKHSLLTCARQEVRPFGRQGHVAHLVFDLRGSGNSDTRDDAFALDLAAIRAWAQERFPALGASSRPAITFFGYPETMARQVNLFPMRSGVILEHYFYPAIGVPSRQRPPVLYLSTYGNFTPKDDAYCAALASAGYDVYGCDPLRYLLHASAEQRLTPRLLAEDLSIVRELLGAAPIIIGQPVAAGLALLWAAGEAHSRGVIAIGQAQLGFKPRHIFDGQNAHTFFLGRYVHRISPQPTVLVGRTGHPLGGSTDELGMLHQTCSFPRRLEFIEKLTATQLLEWLSWMQTTNQS